MNEGEYLELTNQLKQKFDKNEKEIEAMRETYEALRKDVISMYGFFRVIDNLIQEDENIDGEIMLLCTSYRSFLSEVFASVTGSIHVCINIGE